MFVCGPTVYDVSHIGHGKSYVAYDIIARYLRKKGYAVFFVLNITDIDDKIINRAKESKEDPLKLSERYAQAFYRDMKDLHVNSINVYAKASDYIPEIISQIQGLVDKGIGYRIAGGVYYDISKFPEYGKLSRQNLEQLTVHRVDPDPEKRNPGDFVLWKNQKPGEAEIAQAEGLTGKKPLAKYWAHTGLLSIKGQEMHKSLGNFVPIQDAIQKVGVEALRVLYASTHYRSPLDYTEDTLVQAASLARRFRRAYDQLQRVTEVKAESKTANESLKSQVDEIRTEFFAAMDDDFNTPGALSAYVRIVGLAEEHRKSLSTESAAMLLEAMKELASVLGLLETELVPRQEFLQLVNLLTSLRNELRAKREYALSDRIREQLQKVGETVEDEAQ